MTEIGGNSGHTKMHAIPLAARRGYTLEARKGCPLLYYVHVTSNRQKSVTTYGFVVIKCVERGNYNQNRLSALG